MRSSRCRPRFRYRFAIETTRRRFAEMRLAFARSALASPVRIAASVASRARRRTTGASSSVARSFATTRSSARLASRTSRSVSASSSHVLAASRRPRAKRPARSSTSAIACERAVLVVALVVDRRARHVAQAQLLLAQRSPDGGRARAMPTGDATMARSVRRSPSSMRRARSTSPSRVRSGTRASCSKYVVTASDGEPSRTGVDGKGGGHCALKGEYGPSGSVGSTMRPKRPVGHGCSTPFGSARPQPR